MKLKNYNRQAGEFSGWIIIVIFVLAAHVAFVIAYVLVPKATIITPQGKNMQHWGDAWKKVQQEPPMPPQCAPQRIEEAEELDWST